MLPPLQVAGWFSYIFLINHIFRVLHVVFYVDIYIYMSVTTDMSNYLTSVLYINSLFCMSHSQVAVGSENFFDYLAAEIVVRIALS